MVELIVEVYRASGVRAQSPRPRTCKKLMLKSYPHSVPLLTLRVIKVMLVVQVGLFALLVGINNIVDYGSNFEFVQHVLRMDTTFEGNRLMWRAIDVPWVHHLAYALIILAECTCGVVCLFGAWCMWLQRRSEAALFFMGVMWASVGLSVGISLWFTGFMTVGAEWFLMWQSEIWNGQSAAFRFIVILFAVLLFLHLPEPKAASSTGVEAVS